MGDASALFVPIVGLNLGGSGVNEGGLTLGGLDSQKLKYGHNDNSPLEDVIM